MEDPEKRKERLQAMRIEAAHMDASAETSMNSGHLSNPLAETSGAFPSQETSYQTQRFDYYTDPLSAFSSNKRNKTDQGTEIGSPVSQFPPSIPGPMGGPHQAHRGGFQAGGHYDRCNPHINPRGTAHPSPLYHGTPQESWNNFRPPTHNFRPPFQSPNHVAGPFPNYQGSPNHVDRFGGRGNYDRPLNPNYAPPFSNYGRQNAQWAGRTGHGSGRGGAGGRYTNTGFGRNGGRQQRYAHGAYQEPGPERFYHDSMAEDPWKHLEPVLWKNRSGACASSNGSTQQAWLPKSIAPKNPTVPEFSDKQRNTRQSLAEYLAASLDEAVCNEANN